MQRTMAIHEPSPARDQRTSTDTSDAVDERSPADQAQRLNGAHSGRPGRRVRNARKLRILKMLLIASVVTFALVMIVMTMLLAVKNEEHRELTGELNRAERLLEQATAELSRVRQERSQLLAGELPGLIPLELDEAITIGDGYVRNLIFTQTGVGKAQQYEYRVVLHNKNFSVVYPSVRILLFNDVGVQVGHAEVGKLNSNASDRRTLLDPGEVRSYSGAVEMTQRAEPRYFIVQVD